MTWRLLRRGWIYLWVLPTSLPGIALALLTVLSGGKVRVVDGVLEAGGGASRIFLQRVAGLFLSGGASAMTLGHVVLGRDAQLLERTRAHERVHVRQCERWGPLFIPAYLVASIAAWARGGDAYRDNVFERQAFSEVEIPGTE